MLRGLPSTLGATMEMMILHGKAVARGLSRACSEEADLASLAPFGVDAAFAPPVEEVYPGGPTFPAHGPRPESTPCPLPT